MPEDKTPNWTPQQLHAIKARDADVLVSASAGTGKTAVLSGRCVDLVADKNICPDIWSILVLTFTDAAAQQMRSRIAEHLRNTIAKKPDKHLKHQLLLLQGADISTIHAFCKRLITDHFHELGIDPAFRVIDSDEAKLLKAQVLEKTIEWAWLQSNLTEPLAQLFYRRDIRSGEGFLKKIINISDFLDTIVSRQNWYRRADLLAQHADSFAGSLGQKQKQIVEEKLKRAIDQLNQAENLYKTTDPNGDWHDTCRQNYIQPIAQCLEALQSDDWDKTARLIIDYKKPRIKTPKDIPEKIAQLIKDTTKKALDSVAGLSELAVINPDYMDKVAIHTGRQTRVLVELIRKFDQLYDQAKRNANCMDFADLEHHALKLLTKDDSTDKPSPSRTALALRNTYKYIFVDEYQDINSVQKTILDMLSPGGNIFVVGDVKQSIYAWRGAKPDIFIEQLTRAVNQSQTATRVDLNANFRSAEGILNFVNKVFEKIMTASFAKIDYDESAMLKAAATKKQPPNQCPVEFHLIDKKPQDQENNTTETENSTEENPNTIDSTQQQAALIAKRIKKIVGAESGKPEFQIFDKQQDKTRDVQYRDIVILMRSLAKKAIQYVEILRLAGVPVSCDSVAGYFEATEISDMLSLLKVLDNPQRDIELTAVLRSPLFSFSDTELTKIRIAENSNNNKSFYQCVQNFNADDPLAQKLKKAIQTIENWRTLARRGSIADLIWQIYRRTDYLSFVSALPNGQARRANLLKLHDRAIQFEGFVSTGPVASLTRFVEFIEKLQELGQDWAPAQPDSSAANAVRILSVHKSKGLEFPVVFIAELNGKFNISDTTEECLTDSNHALGLKIIDPASNTRLSSLAHQVIAEQKRNITLAEEMRILYVATTRAKERLILTASEKPKKCREIITQGFLLGPEKINDWQLRS
ncbi:MAG: helicase-exonuclease AddAB subunit AddA [Planctomycetota bacterium]|jgi:ATP-dependent helicase/nuclease subunit A